MKNYVPVGNFEEQTSHCPTYIAWLVLAEVRDYFREPIPEVYADELARRAELVFAKHPFWQRKYKGARGRGYLLSSMRHWLAGVLAKERPSLFEQLPENFKIGGALPLKPLSPQKKIRPNRKVPSFAHRFHGCELLAG
jgi:hypothetical protein